MMQFPLAAFGVGRRVTSDGRLPCCAQWRIVLNLFFGLLKGNSRPFLSVCKGFPAYQLAIYTEKGPGLANLRFDQLSSCIRLAFPLNSTSKQGVGGLYDAMRLQTGSGQPMLELHGPVPHYPNLHESMGPGPGCCRGFRNFLAEARPFLRALQSSRW